MGKEGFVKDPTTGISYAATIFARDTAELGSYTTLGALTEGGYASGQRAFVQSNNKIYTLQNRYSVADGSNVVDTVDDPSRQWVCNGSSGLYVDSCASSGTQLAALDCTYLDEGTIAYVGTLKTKFVLTKTNQTAAACSRIAALDKAGYMWIREYPSPAWWSQTVWTVDPANSSGIASDENDGTPSHPLSTFAEFTRRMFNRLGTGSDAQQITVNLIGDLADNDGVYATMEASQSAPAPFLIVAGLVTIIPVGTITSAQTKNAPLNQGNVITVPGFDFSPHIGRNVRLVGTTTVVAAIEEAPSLGVARLCEQWSGGAGTSGSFTAGQTIEICSLPKVPDLETHGIQVNLQDVKIDRGSNAISLVVDRMRGSLTLTRCEMRGVGGGIQHQVYCSAFSLNGGSMVGSTWIFNMCSFNTLCSAMINCPTVYLSATTSLRHHLAYFGGTNSTIYAYDFASIRLNGDFHMFNLASTKVGIAMRYGSQVELAAYYYGSGNNSNSAGISMLGNTRFYYVGAGYICMDAGMGLIIDSNDSPTTTGNGGTQVPFANLPYPATPGTLTPRLSAVLVA